jgi:hypothetical protein
MIFAIFKLLADSIQWPNVKRTTQEFC